MVIPSCGREGGSAKESRLTPFDRTRSRSRGNHDALVAVISEKADSNQACRRSSSTTPQTPWERHPSHLSNSQDCSETSVMAYAHCHSVALCKSGIRILRSIKPGPWNSGNLETAVMQERWMSCRWWVLSSNSIIFLFYASSAVALPLSHVQPQDGLLETAWHLNHPCLLSGVPQVKGDNGNGPKVCYLDSLPYIFRLIHLSCNLVAQATRLQAWSELIHRPSMIFSTNHSLPFLHHLILLQPHLPALIIGHVAASPAIYYRRWSHGAWLPLPPPFPPLKTAPATCILPRRNEWRP